MKKDFKNSAKTLTSLVASAALATLASCAPSSESSSDTGRLKLDIQGTAPGSLAAASYQKSGLNAMNTSMLIEVSDQLGNKIGELTLTDARAALKDIEFDRDDDEDESIEDVDLPGPFVVNLINNSISPSIEDISLPVGRYKEIELDLDKIGGDEQDETGSALVDPADALFGNSIYVEGTYTGVVSDGAGGTKSVTDASFRMAYNLDEEFELTGPGEVSEGFQVGASGTNNIIIAFRLARWFAFDDTETNNKGIDFRDLVEDGSGNLVLDKDSVGDNKDIRDIIKDNIKESADYGKDLDEDGVLESDEDDDEDDSLDD